MPLLRLHPVRRQTYTAPQSTGQYRFIFGDGTVDLPGEVLDSAKPTEEQKSRMTDKQVRKRAEQD